MKQGGLKYILSAHSLAKRDIWKQLPRSFKGKQKVVLEDNDNFASYIEAQDESFFDTEKDVKPHPPPRSSNS